MKIRWQSHQTASAGNKEMMILCNELGGNGWFPKADGSNTRFILSLPLDQSIAVSNVYSNFTTEFDEIYPVAKNVNELNIQILIDGIPALDVSPSNPVEMELGLYTTS